MFLPDKDLVVESLQYCQREKGLEIYAWCIMSNHLHLTLGTTEQHLLQDIIRDFKKYFGSLGSGDCR